MRNQDRTIQKKKWVESKIKYMHSSTIHTPIYAVDRP